MTSDPQSLAPKSLVMTSTHKAGSSIAHRIVLQFARDMGYGEDLIEPAGWRAPGSLFDYCVAAQGHMQDRGMYYGMFRDLYMGDMPRLLDMRMIMQVRDQRDCITSHYYSMAQSHALSPDPARAAEFSAKRAEVQTMSVDEFALNYHRFAAAFPERLAILQSILRTHPDCLLLKYEDMVSAPQIWLDTIAQFLDHPIQGKLQRRLTRIADFTPSREDPNSHRRQITPGDHRRKLKPETIEQLNADLTDGLAFFGYDP